MFFKHLKCFFLFVLLVHFCFFTSRFRAFADAQFRNCRYILVLFSSKKLISTTIFVSLLIEKNLRRSKILSWHFWNFKSSWKLIAILTLLKQTQLLLYLRCSMLVLNQNSIFQFCCQQESCVTSIEQEKFLAFLMDSSLLIWEIYRLVSWLLSIY